MAADICRSLSLVAARVVGGLVVVLRESLHVEGQWRATHRNAVRSASRNSGGIGLRAALGHKFWWRLAVTRTSLLGRYLVIGALLSVGVLVWRWHWHS